MFSEGCGNYPTSCNKDCYTEFNKTDTQHKSSKGRTIAKGKVTVTNTPKVVGRITKDLYYLEIAKSVSKRSTCIRRQYGAVIVKNDEIIATGYNGSPRGEINCCDTGECWREQNNIPSGQQYEKCVSIHAEQNAIISASRVDMLNATMYLAGFEKGKVIKAIPCTICERMIKNAGIDTVIGTEQNESTCYNECAESLLP